MPPVTLNRNTRSDFTRHSISDLGKMIAQEIQSDDKSVEDKEKAAPNLKSSFVTYCLHWMRKFRDQRKCSFLSHSSHVTRAYEYTRHVTVEYYSELLALEMFCDIVES